MKSIFTFRRLLISLCVLFSLWSIFKLEMQPTQAAQLSSNIEVVIAVDVTPSDCILTHTQITKTHHTSTTHMPCPPGTFIKTVKVALSQARSQQEPYVILPEANASPTIWKQTGEKIQQIVEAKRNVLQSLHKRKTRRYSDCGETNYWSAGANVYGDHILVEVEDQISYSCSSLVLDTAWVQGYSPVNNPLWWYESDYARSGWRCPPGYFIGDQVRSYTIDSVQPENYYFVWQFTYYDPCANGPPDYYETASVGPLN